MIRGAGIALLAYATTGPAPSENNSKENLMAGETDEAKGRVKKAAGELTGDKGLKREGDVDKASGKVKKATDKVADKVRDAVHKK